MLCAPKHRLEILAQWEGFFNVDGTPEETREHFSFVSHLDKKRHEFYACDPMPGCKYRHHRSVCKCHCPLLQCGQDERIFKQFLTSSRVRALHGYRGLRKMTEGMGVMISGFVDVLCGFGFPMTNEELGRATAARRVCCGKDHLPLKAWPGVHFLEYGKSKAGYWMAADSAKHLEEVIDCYEWLYPAYQLHFSFDWSSGHTAHRDGCPSELKMNVAYGGKQPISHASRKTEACLGPAG